MNEAHRLKFSTTADLTFAKNCEMPQPEVQTQTLLSSRSPPCGPIGMLQSTSTSCHLAAAEW